IDPLLLYAVSLTESALGNYHQTSPSIYAIRTPDGALYPKTLPEAKQALSDAVARYGHHKIDVGLMQINGQHWKNIDNKSSLFNPTFNVTFGARILKTALNSTDDRVVGIGHYHSYTLWRAVNYGKRVLAIYNNLKRL
ncbi:MAG: transglycosylase SLT domain-containing protein, partial [Succinivibrio sp.]